MWENGSCEHARHPNKYNIHVIWPLNVHYECEWSYTTFTNICGNNGRPHGSTLLTTFSASGVGVGVQYD